MGIPLLNDIVVIFGLSIAVIYVCYRLNIPAIVGFLLTGILAGPYGLKLVSNIHQVEILAEVGVVLLLFTIGMEFSLKSLMKIKKSVLIGGSLQVLLTIFTTSLIAYKLGRSIEESIFIGFLIALSSTAIVLKLMQQRAEVDSPHGKTTLAVLIFQDIIIVPKMLITPILAGSGGDLTSSLLLLLGKAVVVIFFVFVSAKWIVPFLLFQITKTKNRELFLLFTVVLCFAVAWVTSSIGLSLALGAFLAGLIISESEYSHEALGNILPFRDVFTSFFFVSIGMLLNVGVLVDKIGVILLIAVGVILLKAFIAFLVSIFLGFPFRTSILVGFALSQVGEFSFILSESGLKYGLITKDTYQIFLAVFVVTMAATPFVIAFAPKIADLLLKLPIPEKLIKGLFPIPVQNTTVLKDHLIIIGYGLNGKNLANAARIAGIEYVIIDMNPETVRREKAKGVNIYYGDCTHEAVLHCANVTHARVVVVAISDPAATRMVTDQCRKLNQNVNIIARTHHIQEMKPLYELGANEVVPEEFETSIEIFTRVLTDYCIPRSEIERFVERVRSDGYEMFRDVAGDKTSFQNLKLNIPNIEVTMIQVLDDSPIIGKTIKEIDLRKKYDVSLLSVFRGTEMISKPKGDFTINESDILFVIGSLDEIFEIPGLYIIHKDDYNYCK